MENVYFKMIGQKAPNGKMVLIAVVDDDIFGNVPSIFETQCLKLPATIYTGTYPQLKVNTDTIKDRTKELTGLGIDGIITNEEWYVKVTKEKDLLGILLKQ